MCECWKVNLGGWDGVAIRFRPIVGVKYMVFAQVGPRVGWFAISGG